jgi:RNA polymerase sigma-70 factor (ECF subfamily)
MTYDDDQALVAEARAGSRLALSRLIDRHQGAVRAFLRRVAVDREDADDLAQETFVTAWTQLATWRGQSTVRAWLLGIAWRKARSAGRSMFRRMARDRAWSDNEALAPRSNVSAEDRLALEGALGRLNQDQRAAVALCLAEDYSHAEAAEILGLPLGTLKSQVLRGRAKLLEVLEETP